MDSNKYIPKNVWSDRSKVFPRTIEPDRPWYFYARRLVENTGLKFGKAIDLGCGLGEFMMQLNDIGFEVKGLDGEPNQVEQLKQLGMDVQVADLESNLPFEDNSFDLAACLEVIEHVARAEHLLREIARILISNGFLVISTPNFSCWQNRLRYFWGHGPVNEGIHLRFFTPYTLEKALNTNGFKIVERVSFGPITGLNFFLRKLGKKTKHWTVPRKIESIFAEDLVYLARKVTKSATT